MSLIHEARDGSAVRRTGAQQNVEQAEASGTPIEDNLNPLALVFLDSPLARRLAVAWEGCDRDEQFWLAVAGVSRSEAEDASRICFALRHNKICRSDGTTSPVALAYVRTIVAAPLTKAAGKAQGGRRRGR